MYKVVIHMPNGQVHEIEAESASAALTYAEEHYKGYVRLEAKSDNVHMSLKRLGKVSER